MILIWMIWPLLAVVVGVITEEDAKYCLLDTDKESLSGHSCMSEETSPSDVSVIQQLYGKNPEQYIVPLSSNLHISVKTTSTYHKPRLSLILLTWLQTVAPEQVSKVARRRETTLTLCTSCTRRYTSPLMLRTSGAGKLKN